jgi:hypothetical protein
MQIYILFIDFFLYYIGNYPHLPHPLGAYETSLDKTLIVNVKPFPKE